MDIHDAIGLAFMVLGASMGIFWLFRRKSQFKAVLWFCGSLIVAGLCLCLYTRITEVQFLGATIKAAAQQATIDAKVVAEIRARTEAQSATIDLIAKEASDAHQKLIEIDRAIAANEKRSEEIAKTTAETDARNTQLGQKTVELESLVKRASDAVSEVTKVSEFMKVVLAAQSDNRPAYDQLERFHKTRSFTGVAHAGNMRA
jgi:chromosome segregation ATPase